MAITSGLSVDDVFSHKPQVDIRAKPRMSNPTQEPAPFVTHYKTFEIPAVYHEPVKTHFPQRPTSTPEPVNTAVEVNLRTIFTMIKPEILAKPFCQHIQKYLDDKYDDAVKQYFEKEFGTLLMQMLTVTAYDGDKLWSELTAIKTMIDDALKPNMLTSSIWYRKFFSCLFYRKEWF